MASARFPTRRPPAPSVTLYATMSGKSGSRPFAASGRAALKSWPFPSRKVLLTQKPMSGKKLQPRSANSSLPKQLRSSSQALPIRMRMCERPPNGRSRGWADSICIIATRHDRLCHARGREHRDFIRAIIWPDFHCTARPAPARRRLQIQGAVTLFAAAGDVRH